MSLCVKLFSESCMRFWDIVLPIKIMKFPDNFDVPMKDFHRWPQKLPRS